MPGLWLVMPGHDRASLPLMAQVCVPNGAGLRSLVVDNHLIINIFRKILGSICAEDFPATNSVSTT